MNRFEAYRAFENEVDQQRADERRKLPKLEELGMSAHVLSSSVVEIKDGHQTFRISPVDVPKLAKFFSELMEERT